MNDRRTTSARRSHIGSAALALLVATIAAPVNAQQQGQPAAARTGEAPERVFDGRVFLSPGFMPTPFLATHFEFQQGVTQVQVDGYPVTESRRLDVDLVGIRQRIAAGLRFADRFEVSGFAIGELLTGSSGRSVIVAGANFLYGAGLAGKVRLLRSTRSTTQLTLRLQGMGGRGGLLDMLRLVDAMADDTSLQVQTILERRIGQTVLGDTSRWEATGQLLAAQGLGKNFDLQGGVGLNYTTFTVELYDPQTNSEFETTLDSVGPVASIVFGAKATPILPLGFMLEYVLQSNREVIADSDEADWADPSHLLGVGIHNVDPNFQVGLTLARLMNTEPVTTIDPFTGSRLMSDAPAVNYIQLQMSMSW